MFWAVCAMRHVRTGPHDVAAHPFSDTAKEDVARYFFAGGSFIFPVLSTKKVAPVLFLETSSARTSSWGS